MVENKGSLFGIIALIIGATGLGVGAYSLVNFQIVEGPEGSPGEDGVDGTNGINGTDGIDGINGTLDNLVGIWESVYCNCTSSSAYLDVISVGDIRVNRSEYFYLSYSPNTTFHFIKKGWYRYTFRFFWRGLNSDSNYALNVDQHNVGYWSLVYLIKPVDYIYLVETVAYIFCDVDDFLYFYCYSINPQDEFYIDTMQIYNQLVIEYIGD